MKDAAGKRLVIFGCGYVGGELARQAVACGVRVTALTRNGATAVELRGAGAEVVVADLADESWHTAIGGGAEWVVNTVSAGGGGVDGYRRSYVDGLKSVAAWARETGPIGTLVYTSSTSVYPQDGGVVVDEEAATGGSERAEILVEAEKILLTAAAAIGVAGARGFVLRLAGIYGPRRVHLVEQVRSGEVSGFGTHRLNLIHRDDGCAAIWAALGAPPEIDGGIFNVVDDGAAAKAEVVAWLAGRLGVKMPAFTGAPAGGRRTVTPDRVIANAKIKARLGWHPRFPDFRGGYENVLAAEAD